MGGPLGATGSVDQGLDGSRHDTRFKGVVARLSGYSSLLSSTASRTKAAASLFGLGTARFEALLGLLDM